jgi:hypothetical protein
VFDFAFWIKFLVGPRLQFIVCEDRWLQFLFIFQLVLSFRRGLGTILTVMLMYVFDRFRHFDQVWFGYYAICEVVTVTES